MILDDTILNILKTEEPSIQELRNISKNLGIKLRRSMKKRDIIKEIKKELLKMEEDGLISFETDNTLPPSNAKTTLPETYDENSMILLPINPNYMYASWDFDEKTKDIIENLPKDTKTILRVYNTEKNEIIRNMETPVDLNSTNSFYFNVPDQNTFYTSEIGYVDKNNDYHKILNSEKIKSLSSEKNKNYKEQWLNLKTKKTEEKIQKNFMNSNTESLTGSPKGINDNIQQKIENNINSGGEAFIWTLVKNSKSGGIK